MQVVTTSAVINFPIPSEHAFQRDLKNELASKENIPVGKGV